MKYVPYSLSHSGKKCIAARRGQIFNSAKSCLDSIEKFLARKLHDRFSVFLMAQAKAILVVEDELPVRKFVSELLQNSGYTVIAASSAPDAIHALAGWKGSLDLLIADIELGGGMSGIELAKHLEAVRPDLRVLLMSGAPQRAEALANSNAFLQKPFAPRCRFPCASIGVTSTSRSRSRD